VIIMKKFAAFVVGATFFLAGGIVWALPIMTLSDGTTTITVTDGGAKDFNPLTDAVTYVGSVGGWFLNVSTGLSPAPGFGVPHMDLNSISSTLGAGDLTITFFDTITSPWTGPGVYANVGGTLASGGTATFDTLINNSSVSRLFFNTLGAFSGTDLITFEPTGNDELKMIVTIHHEKMGTTSFDYELAPVPEPSTLLLLGGGLLGLGFYGRRRMKA
jgi:hypothetical protein